MNLENGHYTWEEIQSQPAAWQEALAVLTGKRAMLEKIAPARFDQVIFTGCGSTYYLAQAASALYAEPGRIPHLSCGSLLSGFTLPEHAPCWSP
jgi:glucosamine--fructose-6-phosphate aminotransferase (isomerizing)